MDRDTLIMLDAQLHVWIDDVECGCLPTMRSLLETRASVRAELDQLHAPSSNVTRLPIVKGSGAMGVVTPSGDGQGAA